MTAIVQERPQEKQRKLSAFDRCDRCGAQALAVATPEGGTGSAPLMFCGHHTREYEANLVAQGFSISRP